MSSIFFWTASLASADCFAASSFASFMRALAFSNFSSSIMFPFSSFPPLSGSSSRVESCLERDSATFIRLRTTSISPGLAVPSPSSHNVVRSLMEIRASDWRDGTALTSLSTQALLVSIFLETNPPRTSRLGPSFLFTTSRPSFFTSSSEQAKRYWARSFVVVRYCSTRLSPSKLKPLSEIFSCSSLLSPQLENFFSSASKFSLVSGFWTAKTFLWNSRISPSHSVGSPSLVSSRNFSSSSIRLSSSSCSGTFPRFRLPAIFYTVLLKHIEKLQVNELICRSYILWNTWLLNYFCLPNNLTYFKSPSYN